MWLRKIPVCYKIKKISISKTLFFREAKSIVFIIPIVIKE